MTAYYGGKNRLGPSIAAALTTLQRHLHFPRPTTGSRSAACVASGHIQGGSQGEFQEGSQMVRFASDVNADVISMWQALQAGWVPPETCSEAEYESLKNSQACPLTIPSWRPPGVLFGHSCAFRGQFFGSDLPELRGRQWTGFCRPGDPECPERLSRRSRGAVSWRGITGRLASGCLGKAQGGNPRGRRE